MAMEQRSHAHRFWFWRLVAMTVVVGAGVGLITGLSLRFVFDVERTTLAALTASITSAVTITFALGRFHAQQEPPAG